jgi:hypothetical protein
VTVLDLNGFVSSVIVCCFDTCLLHVWERGHWQAMNAASSHCYLSVRFLY